MATLLSSCGSYQPPIDECTVDYNYWKGRECDEKDHARRPAVTPPPAPPEDPGTDPEDPPTDPEDPPEEPKTPVCDGGARACHDGEEPTGWV